MYYNSIKDIKNVKILTFFSACDVYWKANVMLVVCY
jgi:hypothetical protein